MQPMYVQEAGADPSLGETLQKARAARGDSLEEAARITRIPHRYLEALEQENYDILPAPVYARGFLRSYAGYLGLEPGQLMPFFPAGPVEDPRLESLPKTIKRSQVLPFGKFAIPIAVLVVTLAVVMIYALAQNSGESALTSPVVSADASSIAGGAVIADMVGQDAESAVAALELQGADYVVVAIQSSSEAGQVVEQSPAPDSTLAPGGLVTLFVSR